jgi:hypothetical protein
MTSPQLLYKEIPLSKGQVALVDPDRFDELNSVKWHAQWNKSTNSFYAVRRPCVNGKWVQIMMHRVILGLEKGDRRRGDHIEPSRTLDNRIYNLRIATPAENVWNSRISIRNTSGFKGVSLTKRLGLWRATIIFNGVYKSLGHYHTPEEAFVARCEATKKYHGEFARNQ